PFIFFYLIPYLAGGLSTNPVKQLSVIFLGLLPLTLGYAIFRYRLMYVDLIFKRVMVYTLAAATIACGYFAMIAIIAGLVYTRMPSSGPVGMVLAIVVTALLF